MLQDDSEWETDGEDNPNEHTDNQLPTDKVKLKSRVDNNNEDSDSDYDCVLDADTRNSSIKSDPKSKSKFYISSPENDPDIVHLMRGHSSKKERQVRLKKR